MRRREGRGREGEREIGKGGGRERNQKLLKGMQSLALLHVKG